MIKLTKEEEQMKDKNELVFYWLIKNEISYKDITESYVQTIEIEKNYLKDTLSKSDVYVSTLINNSKKEIEYQIPFAIKYMLENKRLEGSKWYEDLRGKDEN